MSGHDRPPHDGPVASSKERQVTLWIDSGRPPVGRVGTPSAAPVAFVGWLDLLAQLSHLLDGDAPDNEQEQTS